MIQIKRVYDPPEDSDGLRVLVERLWPTVDLEIFLLDSARLKEIKPQQ